MNVIIRLFVFNSLIYVLIADEEANSEKSKIDFEDYSSIEVVALPSKAVDAYVPKELANMKVPPSDKIFKTASISSEFKDSSSNKTHRKALGNVENIESLNLGPILKEKYVPEINITTRDNVITRPIGEKDKILSVNKTFNHITKHSVGKEQDNKKSRNTLLEKQMLSSSTPKLTIDDMDDLLFPNQLDKSMSTENDDNENYVGDLPLPTQSLPDKSDTEFDDFLPSRRMFIAAPVLDYKARTVTLAPSIRTPSSFTGAVEELTKAPINIFSTIENDESVPYKLKNVQPQPFNNPFNQENLPFNNWAPNNADRMNSNSQERLYSVRFKSIEDNLNSHESQDGSNVLRNSMFNNQVGMGEPFPIKAPINIFSTIKKDESVPYKLKNVQPHPFNNPFNQENLPFNNWAPNNADRMNSNSQERLYPVRFKSIEDNLNSHESQDDSNVFRNSMFNNQVGMGEHFPNSWYPEINNFLNSWGQSQPIYSHVPNRWMLQQMLYPNTWEQQLMLLNSPYRWLQPRIMNIPNTFYPGMRDLKKRQSQETRDFSELDKFSPSDFTTLDANAYPHVIAPTEEINEYETNAIQLAQVSRSQNPQLILSGTIQYPYAYPPFDPKLYYTQRYLEMLLRPRQYHSGNSFKMNQICCY